MNKNTINTPKNIQRFTFLKNGNHHNNMSTEESKNVSLPKTASTINNNRTNNMLEPPSTANSINTKNHINSQASLNIDKKQISK